MLPKSGRSSQTGQIWDRVASHGTIHIRKALGSRHSTAAIGETLAASTASARASHSDRTIGPMKT